MIEQLAARGVRVAGIDQRAGIDGAFGEHAIKGAYTCLKPSSSCSRLTLASAAARFAMAC